MEFMQMAGPSTTLLFSGNNNGLFDMLQHALNRRPNSHEYQNWGVVPAALFNEGAAASHGDTRNLPMRRRQRRFEMNCPPATSTKGRTMQSNAVAVASSEVHLDFHFLPTPPPAYTIVELTERQRRGRLSAALREKLRTNNNRKLSRN